jgi:hypothetical protein
MEAPAAMVAARVGCPALTRQLLHMDALTAKTEHVATASVAERIAPHSTEQSCAEAVGVALA